MARKLFNGFFSKVKLFCLYSKVELSYDTRRNTDKTLGQAPHKSRNIMVVAIIVSTIVVISHKVEKETLGLHRCLAVLTLDSSNSLGDSTLYKVQASIREIIGPCHRRSR